METLVNEDGALNYKPQFELGVDLVTQWAQSWAGGPLSGAGRGAAMQPARGLFWQGNAQVPVSRSDDYRGNGQFSRLGHPRRVWTRRW